VIAVCGADVQWHSSSAPATPILRWLP